MHPVLADRQRLQLHLIAWALAGGMLGLLARALVGLTWAETIAFGLPLGLLAAPISLSAWYVCRAMPADRTPPLRLGMTALLAALVTASLWAVLGQIWWTILVRSGFISGSTADFSALFALLVGLGALAYLVAVTAHYVMQAFEASALAARRVLELQVGQRDAELRALRSQLNPHFLFNSLNSIAGLIGADPARARTMCQLLGDFLRDSLTLGTVPRIPLSREMALVGEYLRVEQVRFGSRLGVRTEMTPDCADAAVPPLILQPLVENAVRHGIATRLDGGVVEITASRVGPRVTVAVSNPRDEDNARRGTGVGLDLVRRRLEASFGSAASLNVEATDHQYRVAITIPVVAAS